MLSWVVKVVPQPPEPPSKKADEQKEEQPAAAPPPVAAPPPAQEKKVKFQDECTTEAPKADKPMQEAQAAEENGPAAAAQPGVLLWISGALPQPPVSPLLSRSNSTTKEESPDGSKPEDEKGMIAWIAQGLEKVVPKPELKSKESAEAEQPAEVQPTAPTPAAPAATPEPAAPVTPVTPAAEPQVSAVKVEPEREDKTDNKPPQPSMIDWIKQGIEKVVPQPEIHPKTDAPAASKAEAPAPEPPAAPKPAADTEKSSKEAEPQSNVVGWILGGIERMLPQPVQKQDSGGDEVQSISIVQQNTDLVLEDVEPDKDKQEVKKESEEEEKLQPPKETTEDAGTQMDQSLDSINNDAGEAVLAHLEERLQQERLEAARVAEEMARKAAEEAVRQLEVEHSAKIVIETLPESNEQLPNILEEENEDDPELQNLQDSEDSETAADNTSPAGTNRTSVEEKQSDQCLVDVCPAEEEVTPSSTDVEPASERRDLESPVSQPVIQQPEPQDPEAPSSDTDQAGAAAAAEEEEEEEEEEDGGGGGGLGGVPGLTVEGVDQDGLNIPQIITTPEPGSSTLTVPGKQQSKPSLGPAERLLSALRLNKQFTSVIISSVHAGDT
ncbi:cyclic nucleotide-gated cation channel beta-1-like [Sparus aurata]|uniref:cyclic nucleotide-gated cation channel beta-1-like n=1 Tax=Sparus aurata TaxID=8175 RepID=UPI0011C1366D|nr:cyclic nucleotide-gated cation channel beta-1-like [Sparus aurata]